MTDETCQICTRPARNGAFVCDDCGTNFANDLKALADWLDEDLETAISGAKGVQYRAGRTSGGDSELKVNYRAAELYRKLHRALCDAVDHCLEVGVRHQSPDEGDAVRTVPAMALWLTWRVDGLALDAGGPKHIQAIVKLVERAKDLVFWVPPERRFLGACDLCGEGYVYAEGEDAEAFCNRCQEAFPAEARRAAMLAELDDQLLRAVDIAKLSTYLGLQDNRDKVQRCVNLWHHRGRVTSRGTHKGDPTFRWGDVFPLIQERERRSG